MHIAVVGEFIPVRLDGDGVGDDAETGFRSNRHKIVARHIGSIGQRMAVDAVVNAFHVIIGDFAIVAVGEQEVHRQIIAGAGQNDGGRGGVGRGRTDHRFRTIVIQRKGGETVRVGIKHP